MANGRKINFLRSKQKNNIIDSFQKLVVDSAVITDDNYGITNTYYTRKNKLMPYLKEDNEQDKKLIDFYNENNEFPQIDMEHVNLDQFLIEKKDVSNYSKSFMTYRNEVYNKLAKELELIVKSWNSKHTVSKEGDEYCKAIDSAKYDFEHFKEEMSKNYADYVDKNKEIEIDIESMGSLRKKVSRAYNKISTNVVTSLGYVIRKIRGQDNNMLPQGLEKVETKNPYTKKEVEDNTEIQINDNAQERFKNRTMRDLIGKKHKEKNLRDDLSAMTNQGDIMVGAISTNSKENKKEDRSKTI